MKLTASAFVPFQQQRGKEKGKIRLPLIRMVEFVTDGELDNKANVLQVKPRDPLI